MISRKGIALLAAYMGFAPHVNAVTNVSMPTAPDYCGSSIPALFAPHISILNIASQKVEHYPIPSDPLFDIFVHPPTASTISFCNITITYTHPGWKDHVQIFVALPLQGWNRKFLSLGGSGFQTNPPLEAMPRMAALGYASAATDGGHVGQDMSWALEPNSTLVDYPLLVDMASESLKDMTVIGRHVTEAYYNRTADRTYWVGCSQGGRQGMMMAQRYSYLFDGILANAPALNWNDMMVGLAWPQTTIYETGIVMPACILNAITNASITACDGLDGLKDGIVSIPESCSFDPYSLVGDLTPCNESSVRLTANDAFVARQILDGPNYPNGTVLFPGYYVGTDLTAALSTTCRSSDCPHGTKGGNVLSNNWIPKLLAKDYNFNPLTITYKEFYDFFLQSRQEYDWAIGTNNADLRHLRNTNTKLLTFHGLADQIIPTRNTINYYEQVLSIDPKTTDYYRLFLGPGVMHCGGGLGPIPTAMLEVLEDWVETGNAPTRLNAVSTDSSGTTFPRQLCMYPAVQRYIGGNPTLPSSFACS